MPENAGKFFFLLLKRNPDDGINCARNFENYYFLSFFKNQITRERCVRVDIEYILEKKKFNRKYYFFFYSKCSALFSCFH